MYDQSFNYISLAKMLRKNDFYVLPRLRDQAFKESELGAATMLSIRGFIGHDLLKSSVVRGKSVYRIPRFSDELVLRKIDRNLRKAKLLHTPSRDTIVANLKNLLSESVQCNIYRLDIKSFYESFDTKLVVDNVDSIKNLSPQTKKYIMEILDLFINNGGHGLPRGLAISSTLSEIVMSSFDNYISSMSNVFYYCRYVDDIIIITSGAELPKQFIRKVSSALPAGLYLNKSKESIVSVKDSTPFKSTAQLQSNPEIYKFEYLGYKFSVYEPLKKNEPREVRLDIADTKVKKIKTRLTKAYLDFCRDQDFLLLELRIKFLTSNFSVVDVNRGGYRLAGIYHNYHRINFEKSTALEDLDEYLRRATSSSYGKVFNDFYCKTNSKQRRRLFTFSFKKGFSERLYMHFNRAQFRSIRECWEYV